VQELQDVLQVTTTRESVIVRCMVSVLFEIFASSNAHDTVKTRNRNPVSHQQRNFTVHKLPAIKTSAVEDVSTRVCRR